MANLVTLKRSKHPRYNWIVYYPDGDKRLNKLFKNKTGATGAQEWALSKQQELDAIGSKESAITSEERRAVMIFREFISNHGRLTETPLRAAVDLFISTSNRQVTSIPCSEVLVKLLSKLQVEQKSKRHYDTVKSRAGKFCELYGDRLASDISTDIINEYLQDLGLAPTTIRNHRSSLYGLFAHAKKLKAIDINPVTDAISIKKPHQEIGIYTPNQVAKLLEHIPQRSLAGIAIACFAGLRDSEVQALTWDQIDLTEKTIIVHAEKTSSRRIVDISENLLAWLTPLYKQGEKVTGTPQQYLMDTRQAKKSSNVLTVNNGYRHSFASYHLALFENAPKTALQIGHQTTKVLFEHYRALVTKKSGKSYFNIAPTVQSNITNLSKNYLVKRLNSV